MLQRNIVMLLLAFYAVSGAQTVGDFAPLEVGNSWVYKCIGPVMDSFVITIQLTDSYDSNDSLYHCFLNSIDGISIDRMANIDTLDDGTTIISGTYRFDTTFISEINRDTLVEIDGTIQLPMNVSTKEPGFKWTSYYIPFSRWSVPVLPVWETHSIDTTGYLHRKDESKYKIDSTDYFYSWWNISEINGTNEFVWYPGVFTPVYRYRPGVGLINYHDDQNEHTTMYTLDRDISLLSFNNIPFTAVQTGRTPLSVRRRVVPAVKLSPPHLSIEKNGRVFNLQGRSVPTKAIPGKNVRGLHR